MIKSSTKSVLKVRTGGCSHSSALVHLNRLRVELDLEGGSVAVFGE